MENNCVDTLEYLLKIKSEKKKKEPSRIERDELKKDSREATLEKLIKEIRD